MMPNVYVYVGAGWDTIVFEAEWADSTIIHCIDGQPHSEFGTKTMFDECGKNLYARTRFAKCVLDKYEAAGFTCSSDDRTDILTTGLLDSETDTGSRRVVRFIQADRNIVVWYHFNSGLPTHAAEISQMVGVYQGILCAGHWPHISIMDITQIADQSLIFRGYASTCFHADEDNMDDLSVVGRISYDDEYRNKFYCFVFYDIYGNEYEFATWDDYLDWIDENPDLAYE